MRRREFVTLLGGMSAWPLVARAQRLPMPARRIGVLVPFAENDPERQIRFAAFRQTLERLGWAEGRNIQIDLRFTTADAAAMRTPANELVNLHPDLILTDGTPPTAATLQQTRTIPVVFVQVVDPVGSGFVSSIPRPGGNATGFTNIASSMSGKWLELLRDIAPSTARVAVLFNPDTAPYAPFLDTFKSAAASHKVEGIGAPVHDDSEIKSAIAALEGGGGGLIVLPSLWMNLHRDLLIAAAARHRVPAIYPFRHFAISGGLMAYGNVPADAYRQAAFYVDRILRGAQPTDLPVQAPTKFELLINLRTAAALGLTVPLIMQMTADEVIE